MSEVPDDPDRAETLREIAREVRGESSESESVAALLVRASDLYDPAEETDPQDVYRNMKHILQVKDRGGLRG